MLLGFDSEAPFNAIDFSAGSPSSCTEHLLSPSLGIVTVTRCSQSTPHPRDAFQLMISSEHSFSPIMFSFSVSNLGNSTLNQHTHNALWKDSLEKPLKHFSPN